MEVGNVFIAIATSLLLILKKSASHTNSHIQGPSLEKLDPIHTWFQNANRPMLGHQRTIKGPTISGLKRVNVYLFWNSRSVDIECCCSVELTSNENDANKISNHYLHRVIIQKWSYVVTLVLQWICAKRSVSSVRVHFLITIHPRFWYVALDTERLTLNTQHGRGRLTLYYNEKVKKVGI